MNRPGCLFVLPFVFAVARASVLHVPGEYPSISQALAASQRSDTVLVAAGRYVESLTVPDHLVTIASEFVFTEDTSVIGRTTIEAPLGFASLIAPDNATADSLCVVGLRFAGGELSGTIQRGGVVVENRTLYMYDCRFDSISGGSEGVISMNGGSLFADNLAFLDCHGGANSVLSATHCTFCFDSVTLERIEAGQSFFRTEDCEFKLRWGRLTNSGNITLPRLFDIRGGSDIELVQSQFVMCRLLGGFVVPQNACEVTLSCESCAFESIQCGLSFLELDSRWEEGSTICFRDCSFEEMSVVDGYLGPFLLSLATFGNIGGEVVGNRFIRNHRRQTSALQIRHNARFAVEQNYFVENTTEGWLSSPGGAVVLTGNPDSSFIHNIFYLNQGNAVDHFGASEPGHAEHNYWGHVSGPYNEWSNPEGLGDTVDTLILYQPWEEDTLFLSSLDERSLPLTFALGYPYPNPFNASVTIQYALTREQHVRLEIFDVLGRRVQVLFDERQGIGVHSLSWNAESSASGLYFARLSTIDRAQTVKLMLLK